MQAKLFHYSYLHLFVISAVLWFTLPVFAADRSLTDVQAMTQFNVCERLLEADLSGYYVITNATVEAETDPSDPRTARALIAPKSQIVQLRRLGHTSAYTVSMAKLDLPSSGIRELRFERMEDGWHIGDPGKPEARVNLMTVVRDEDKILFRFENASDHTGFTYDAVPSEHAGGIRGEILRPDGWVMHLNSAFSSDYRFTRIKLDRAFELTVSQSLKSLIAEQSDPETRGRSDYLITVTMKTPVYWHEVESILGTDKVYPLDQAAGTNSDGPFYRFGVPVSIYKLLESMGAWTQFWQVAHIDAMPMATLNEDLRVKIAQAMGIGAPGATVQRTQVMAPPPTPQRTLSSSALGGSIPLTAAPIEADEPTEAVRRLQELSAESFPSSAQAHPRNLDHDQNVDEDHEHEGDHPGDIQGDHH